MFLTAGGPINQPEQQSIGRLCLAFLAFGGFHEALDQPIHTRGKHEIADAGDKDFRLRGKLAEAMGARPDRRRQLAAIDLARSVVAKRMQGVSRQAIPALGETHAELVRLGAQAPTYNFDPGLLVMEIGTLLASLGAPNAPAHG